MNSILANDPDFQAFTARCDAEAIATMEAFDSLIEDLHIVMAEHRAGLPGLGDTLQALASYARFTAYRAGQSFLLDNAESWFAQHLDAQGRFAEAAAERERFAREQAAYAANPDLKFQVLILQCKQAVGLADVARRTGQVSK